MGNKRTERWPRGREREGNRGRGEKNRFVRLSSTRVDKRRNQTTPQTRLCPVKMCTIHTPCSPTPKTSHRERQYQDRYRWAWPRRCESLEPHARDLNEITSSAKEPSRFLLAVGICRRDCILPAKSRLLRTRGGLRRQKEAAGPLWTEASLESAQHARRGVFRLTSRRKDTQSIGKMMVKRDRSHRKVESQILDTSRNCPLQSGGQVFGREGSSLCTGLTAHDFVVEREVT